MFACAGCAIDITAKPKTMPAIRPANPLAHWWERVRERVCPTALGFEAMRAVGRTRAKTDVRSHVPSPAMPHTARCRTTLSPTPPPQAGEGLEARPAIRPANPLAHWWERARERVWPRAEGFEATPSAQRRRTTAALCFSAPSPAMPHTARCRTTLSPTPPPQAGEGLEARPAIRPANPLAHWWERVRERVFPTALGFEAMRAVGRTRAKTDVRSHVPSPAMPHTARRRTTLSPTPPLQAGEGLEAVRWPFSVVAPTAVERRLDASIENDVGAINSSPPP